MNMAELLLDRKNSPANGTTMPGVSTGLVTNNQDPEGMARVKITFPWLNGDNETDWARVSTPMAGKDRGLYFLPEVGDEVLVVFEHGDIRRPYVLGGLWNGKDLPPADNQDGKNHVRLIRSRSGHTIRLNDEAGHETIEIMDKDQNNTIVIDSANNTITVKSGKDILLSAKQGKITLEAQTIELKSSAHSRIEAGAGMDVKASGPMNLKGAMININ